ncbi:trehalose 6-phosphate synthase/phosphatase [Nematocida major]|uniref:trehalose 6-phosphate synthase/phosphatase n=1 Tax=Nematocida major TaxID=1912982 RepID=UPI0020074593|nr:trehalose 6-phosphate synthase/phosphatase [Nematocida major]KAH9385412.1 trehalose 6-phosphate synthase/phosphatase [Nematocida major]
MTRRGKTIIVSGNLPAHCKDGKEGVYAPSYSSVGAAMLYGTEPGERAKTTFIGIASPEGMPPYSEMQPGEFTFLRVETEKRPKDLVFSQHLSQACHYSLGKSALFPQDLEGPYKDYMQFNQEFFAVLKQKYAPHDTIIILGKHLLMLPMLVRKEFPLAKIALVYLCPFPPYELFSCIPYSKNVLHSLMDCDKVELQSPEYLDNFISTAFLLINAQNKEVTPSALEAIKGNSSQVLVDRPQGEPCSTQENHLLPCAEEKTDMLSLLTTAYRTSFSTAEDEPLVDTLRPEESASTAPEEYLEDLMPVVRRLSKKAPSKTYIVYAGDSRVLISVTPKNVPKEFISQIQKADQYTETLEKLRESTRGKKVVLLVETTRKIGTPTHNLFSVLKYLQKNPDTGVYFIRCVVYGESVAFHNTELAGLAERIGSLYPSQFSTVVFPSTYLYFAFLKIADVCLAGSPSDSLSLVATEYAEINPTGRLIVPYSSGISFENALYTLNCPDVTSEVIKNALAPAERKAANLVSTQSWLHSLHHILRTDPPCTDAEHSAEKIPVHISQDVLQKKDRIKQAYVKSEKRTIFLDYDGTLTDIVPNPKDAKPTEEVLGVLRKLSSDPKNSVFIVTGRGKEEAEDWFGALNVQIYAEHGTYKKEGGKWNAVPCDLTWMADAVRIIEEYVSYTPGSHIEIKNTCVVFHCKEHGKWCANALQRMLVGKARVVTGKNIIEVRPRGIDKGSCIEKEPYYNTFTLCAGDDATDEDMFMVLLEAPNAYTVCVGDRSTCASLRAQSPKDLRGLLAHLCE